MRTMHTETLNKARIIFGHIADALKDRQTWNADFFNLLLTLGMAITVLFWAVSSASAASLRPDTTVNSSNITLGDVFDGVDHNTDYVLAPAPPPGESIVLDAYSLTRIAKAFGFSWRPSGLSDQITIRRSGRLVSSEDIRAAISQSIKSEMGIKSLFELALANPNVKFHLAENAKDQLTISDLSLNPESDVFHATVNAAKDQKHVRGTLYRITRVPVLNRRIRRGEVIGARDIDWINMRDRKLQSDTITKDNELIGMTPRQALSPLKPISTNSLQLPTAVERSDNVVMIMKNGILSLTAEGKALEDGAMGDLIRVANNSSGRSVKARVTGPKEVTVVPQIASPQGVN